MGDRLELVTGNLELAKNCPSRRQKIEKRLEVLQAKIASIVDANASGHQKGIEEESTYNVGKKNNMDGIKQKEQCSKRAELQQKISLFKKSSGAEKLSDEQRLEVLMDRLELVTGNLELAKNCPSR